MSQVLLLPPYNKGRWYYTFQQISLKIINKPQYKGLRLSCFVYLVRTLPLSVTKWWLYHVDHDYNTILYKLLYFVLDILSWTYWGLHLKEFKHVYHALHSNAVCGFFPDSLSLSPLSLSCVLSTSVFQDCVWISLQSFHLIFLHTLTFQSMSSQM